jgi:outer membrane lipoprotein carrier protein
VRALAVVLSIAALAPGLAPAAARAQATPAPAGQAPAMSPGDSTALALLERTSRAYLSARTLRAEFIQTLTNPRTGNIMRARGEFLQRGPQQFAFVFTEPAEDRIVADGEILWLYLPSTAKGQVLKVPRAAGAGLDLAASVLREPRARYRVEGGDESLIDGRAVRAVRITPRTSDAPFARGTLWIDTQDALVRRAELTEHTGLVRLLDFTRVRTGVELPRDAFTFTPPPGVRVIDQAAMLGGSVPPRTP